MPKTLLLTVALMLTVALLAGCEKEPADPTPTTNAGAAAPAVTFVNTACPIMNANKIDPAKVSTDLIREFKGGKVAFCCGGCPSKWDALSDEEKSAKLASLSTE